MLRVVEVISDMNIGGAGRLLINRIRNTDKTLFNSNNIIHTTLRFSNYEIIIAYLIDFVNTFSKTFSIFETFLFLDAFCFM